jgi:glycosyltransferase involved in cell wall biosynthesis
VNIHIITSSYPASPEDPSGTAGLFIRQFALELVALGHRVVVEPVARKKEYRPDPGVLISPAPWKGGDTELASMDYWNPKNWIIFLHFFLNGIRNTRSINKTFRTDRTLCMWAVPSGIFGFMEKRKMNVPYDVWVLGSDIWKIRNIPFFGKAILKKVIKNAGHVFADGVRLCRDVGDLTGVPCEFLPSSRKMPAPKKKLFLSDGQGLIHFLFVGRYHMNKGPDLLIRATALLPADIRRMIRLHMFGMGPMEGELKNLISDFGLEGTVYLNGPIEAQDFSDYLDSVSFLVIPSRIESIPVVFSDSLQTGTPVVSMPVGDLKDLIEEFGCGVVAGDTTVEALSSAIGKAALMDKETFRENTARAFERFEIKRVVNKWLSMIPADSPLNYLQLSGKTK